MNDLVEQLARLSDEQRLDVFRKAKAGRRRRVLMAVRRVRKTVLAGIISHRKAAFAIDEAAHNRHGLSTPALRIAIQRELKAELGHFEDIPGAESLRKLFENKNLTQKGVASCRIG